MTDQTDYRFSVEHDGTITRARAYRLPSDWTSDTWTHYWDMDTMTAFIDGGYRDGVYAVTGCDNDETERAIAAFKAEQDTLRGASDGLDRLAKRLADNTDARFIHVSLDRGADLYALAWSGDPDNAWRDEIEAVNCGDVWRIECEEFLPYVGEHGAWLSSDEYPEEFYGEDKATSEFARIFPLTEFPAENMVSATD